MPILMPHARLLTSCAAIVFLFGATIILAARVGEPALPLRRALKLIYHPIDKGSLDGTRYLAIMAASWLVAVPLAGALDRLAASGPGRPMQTIGRGGLWSFVACVMLSVIGDALQMTPANQDFGSRLAIDVWVIGMLWWIAWVLSLIHI